MNWEQAELVLLRFDEETTKGEKDADKSGDVPMKGVELIRETAKEGAWHNLRDILIPLQSGDSCGPARPTTCSATGRRIDPADSPRRFSNGEGIESYQRQ
mmetsp:Transcript_24399/g.28108  ORF Transcript_24399/g.28108 Transcript_24399/m.28108 type:complete len:100 (-) Transcript_24399:360-659(-)